MPAPDPARCADTVRGREALEAARDFLSGLLETTGMRGYHQPGIGLVSTRLVLELVTEALDGNPQDWGLVTGPPDPRDLVRELREALGMFSGAMPVSPKEAWDEAIAVARRLAGTRPIDVQPCWKHVWYIPGCWRCRAKNPLVIDGSRGDQDG